MRKTYEIYLFTYGNIFCYSLYHYYKILSLHFVSVPHPPQDPMTCCQAMSVPEYCLQLCGSGHFTFNRGESNPLLRGYCMEYSDDITTCIRKKYVTVMTYLDNHNWYIRTWDISKHFHDIVLESKPLPPICSYNFECPKGYLCANNQCKCRSCRDDSECHKYGMFCHMLPPNGDTGECRKRCTPRKVWTDWCGCGVNEICQFAPNELSPLRTGLAATGICKTPR